MSDRVLVVGDAALYRKLARMLRAEGYGEVYHAQGAEEAFETYRLKRPEIVIMDNELQEGDPLALVGRIVAEAPAPVVMHSSYDQIDRVLEADELGVSAHLFGTVTKENLLGAIRLGRTRFRICQTLRAEIGDCRETLRVRKLIERAKGILMKRNRMGEDEAFIKIQKTARDNNLSMEKVAQSIITANDII